jgi:hypothetical protein
MASEQGKGPTAQDVRMVLHYRDDGPSGPCGQMTSITSPWSRLYTYKSEDDAMAFMRYLEGHPAGFGRRRPRIEAWWYDEHVLEGPVVPEDMRTTQHANASRPEGAPNPAPTPAQSRGTE